MSDIERDLQKSGEVFIGKLSDYISDTMKLQQENEELQKTVQEKIRKIEQIEFQLEQLTLKLNE